MNRLEYGLMALLKRGETTLETRAEKQRNQALKSALGKTAQELYFLGYKHLTADGLQQKHVKQLVEHWIKKEYKPTTIYARLSAIRWWAKQVGCESAVAKSNKAYRLDETTQVIKSLSGRFEDKLSKITDSHVKMSLRLQSVFGLNTMESIKFKPGEADNGYSLSIKNTWRGKNAKRGRTVPCEDALQRVVLEEAKALADQGSGSLILDGRNYIEQFRVYERHLARAGISQEFGGRYRYVLGRYRRLTGRDAPAEGGQPTNKMCPQAQQEHLYAARQIDAEVEGMHPKAVRAILEGSAGMAVA